MESRNAIRKEVNVSPITLSRVYVADFQKAGTKTAELKQTVATKSYYPAQATVSSLQDNIFSAKDFNFEEKEFDNNEKRVAWIDVPEGLSAEEVEAKLASFTEATLYRILSNRPIISDHQAYAIGNPELDVTMDTFANSQAVRYGEGHEEAGKLALDKNGKIQYRAVFFSSKPQEDQDLRTADLADFFSTPELNAEMTGAGHVVTGQEL